MSRALPVTSASTTHGVHKPHARTHTQLDISIWILYTKLSDRLIHIVYSYASFSLTGSSNIQPVVK